MSLTLARRSRQVQVDGLEPTLGFTLQQFAQLMLRLGAVGALNIDGGCGDDDARRRRRRRRDAGAALTGVCRSPTSGSSTTVGANGRLISTPHAYDNATVAERKVTTITCIAA